MSNLLKLEELRSLGLVQEVNRQFFHPRGLALGIEYNDTTNEAESLFVLDYRYDPQGVIYENLNKEIALSKASSVKEMLDSKKTTRKNTLGYITQPLTNVYKPYEYRNIPEMPETVLEESESN